MPKGDQVRTSLRYQPLAVNAGRFAADIVAWVRARVGVELDYSVESLPLADQMIAGLREEGRPVAEVADTLIGFGAYLGEVLVRQAKADWVDFDEYQREVFGHSFGVMTPDGRGWNPLGKAFKRYENGAGDSLHFFYIAAARQSEYPER